MRIAVRLPRPRRGYMDAAARQMGSYFARAGCTHGSVKMVTWLTGLRMSTICGNTIDTMH